MKKKIKDYPNYSIDEEGIIYNDRINIIMKTKLDTRGYPRVNLSNKGIRKTYSIHRLVGLHHIPNPHDYPMINHIDGDKTNNSISNLEWCTHIQNINHGKGTKLTHDEVKEIKQLLIEGFKIKEIAQEFNISIWDIYDIKNYRHWKHL